MNHSDTEPFTYVHSIDKKARLFVNSAADYSDIGLNCFTTCVTKFDSDSLMGYEKACL